MKDLGATIRYPWETPPTGSEAIEVAEGVLWMRLPLPMKLDHVNVYALDDGDSWTVIDTGFDSRKSRAIWEDIFAGPLGGKPVSRVLVTHHHPDHVGGNAELAKKYDLEILGPGHDKGRIPGITKGVNGGDVFTFGGHNVQVMDTPGHTTSHIVYYVPSANAVFVGDTLFMPDYGSARCDFPGGDAGTLYDSVQKLFTLPDETRVFLCHDYKAPGRDDFQWETTIGRQKRHNIL